MAIHADSAGAQTPVSSTSESAPPPTSQAGLGRPPRSEASIMARRKGDKRPSGHDIHATDDLNRTMLSHDQKREPLAAQEHTPLPGNYSPYFRNEQ